MLKKLRTLHCYVHAHSLYICYLGGKECWHILICEKVWEVIKMSIYERHSKSRFWVVSLTLTFLSLVVGWVVAQDTLYLWHTPHNTPVFVCTDSSAYLCPVLEAVGLMSSGCRQRFWLAFFTDRGTNPYSLNCLWIATSVFSVRLEWKQTSLIIIIKKIKILTQNLLENSTVLLKNYSIETYQCKNI